MKGAPLTIGGWPDEEAEETHYGIEIPKLLSVLAFGSLDAEVKGLKDFPKEDRPPVAVVHMAYQIMLGCGMTMLGLAALGGLLAWRKRGLPDQEWYLRMLAMGTPLGMIAVVAGWVVTEVGRQPWIIVGYMRTSEAVTPMPGLVVPFTLFTLLYIGLGITVIILLRRQFLFTVEGGDES